MMKNDTASRQHPHAHPTLHPLLLCLTLLLLLCGCGQQPERTAARLVVRSGNGQCGFPNSELPEPLVIEVSGPKRTGRLGGTSVSPAQNVAVKVETLRASDFSSIAEPAEGRTDAAGTFRCSLWLGRDFGDQYFRVSCPDFPDVKPVLVHAVAGVEIRGGGQEVMAGDSLDEPIVVSLRQADGDKLIPLQGIPVYIKQTSGKKARLDVTQTLSDKNGDVRFNVTTADGYTGATTFIVEVGDGYQYQNSAAAQPCPLLRSRGVPVRVLSLSRWGIAIGLLGGLAIFIFGMTMMSKGLQQIAGERLKSLLQLFAGTRLKAVLAGVVVTSIIQSSSATTVMVVGFVNAQLLNLMQSIGIIYGAAIGTTITGQMVSLKLDGLALPTVCLGVLILMVSSKSLWRGIGSTLLGFGLLFYGMMLMSSEMKVLADFPGFMAFFRTFDCAPVNGTMPFGAILGTILVGTVLTVIVQGSSATVGMTIALAEAGLLNFYTAVPLILGDNIGTTITGHLAALGASRKAKQVAMAASVFKIMGVIIMLPLFYINWNGHPCFLELINQLTSGSVFGQHHENIGRHLANAHTLFNLANVALFIPLTGVVAKLSVWLMPERQDDLVADRPLCFLESHLLNTPSAALGQVVIALGTMTAAAVSLTLDAMKAFMANDATEKDDFDAREAKIDGAQHDIIDYLVQLTRRHLTENQSDAIPMFMHCVNDVERIGDRSMNIFRLIDQMPDGADACLSKGAVDELEEIRHGIEDLSEKLLTAMATNDHHMYDEVLTSAQTVKAMASRFESNHETRLRNQDCTVQKGVVFVEVLANIERIVAHLTNVCERAREMSDYHIVFPAAAR